MQYLLVSVPALLVILFPKSGSGFGLPMLGHRGRFGPMDHMMMMGMMDMDPRVEEMFMGENAINKPEFEQIKLLCEEYVKDSDKRLNLGDSDLELVLVKECEKWQQNRPAFIPHLKYLQQRVTVNPLAAEILNKKE